MTDKTTKTDALACARELLRFIAASPTSYQAVDTLSSMLEKAGFHALREQDAWTLRAGEGYYTQRGGSSLIAFRIPAQRAEGFAITASHSDSPSFKLKYNPEMERAGGVIGLNVEKYGGMLCATWMDRPLSVAGRIAVRSGEGVRTLPVTVERDLLLIPSVAIHMNRSANDGASYNPQTDMVPLFSDASGKGALMKIVAEAAGVAEEDILSSDLFLYNRTPGVIWGPSEEFLSAPRIDNLACAYATMRGLTEAESVDRIALCAVFDNEEVGSSTKQGAASTFLDDTMYRIMTALGGSEEDYRRAIARSFMISADNAHAIHPNHPEYGDPVNRPKLNGGIVIKYNASQRYATDALSDAIFRLHCGRAGVAVQTFVNRSDLAGGSTLGSISDTCVSVNTVDIGLPQLAMHSSYETAGTADVADLIALSRDFYTAAIYGD